MRRWCCLWLVACTPLETLDLDDTDAKARVETDIAVPDSADSGVYGFGDLSLEVVDQPYTWPEEESGGLILLRATSSKFASTRIRLAATSDADGELADPEADANGDIAYPLDGLSAGEHKLTFVATDPDGVVDKLVIDLGICHWPPLQDFNDDPVGQGWTSYGNAHWNSNGWMEITSNAPSQSGSIYKTDREVNPGDVRIGFRIATGGLGNSGADGYSVNIIDVNTVEELEAYIQDTTNGGCLGYGVVNGCGKGGTEAINSVHIEFDTWSNDGNPNVDPVPPYDPVTGVNRGLPQNHVAVHLDGDASNEVLWKQVDLESPVPQWHDVLVTFESSTIIVDFDGVELARTTVSGFTFDGGWIGVSGATGWAYNEHRFDDLQLYDRCAVPER